MGLRMKNFNIVEVHLKIWFLGGGFMKNQDEDIEPCLSEVL